MTILSEKVFIHGGPYMEMAVLENKMQLEENDWPSTKLYGEGVFFNFADDLVGLYCDVQSWSGKTGQVHKWGNCSIMNSRRIRT
jgi:hypothetical protein